jgi:hypothetical protein
MKRKYKKTKKGHASRNATIKRRKRTRRQCGGAYIQNLELPEYLSPVDKREYNVIKSDYYENGSIMYSLECKAKAIVLAVGQTCGASMCPPRVDYRVLDGPVILKTYQPDGTLHSTYVGDFEDGKMHGRGKYTFHTHPVFHEYEGEFDDGEMHGTGKMVMKNGDAYDGEFQHDLMHGTGTITFREDGSRYVGGVVDGKMHGVGDVYDETGTLVFKARFENNEPIEQIGEEMEEEEEEEEEEEHLHNPTNIFQNTRQNTFGSRPNFFEPSGPQHRR